MSTGFSQRITTNGKLPRLPFERMKDAVLGKAYELSFAVVSAAHMREANNTYRGKNEPTDILSFELTAESGEILFHLPSARRKAHIMGLNERDYLGFLFIHGLLHLKGHAHGSIMEREERKFCKRFKLKTP